MTTMFDKPRNSRMELDEVYFWTDTIKGWNTLLSDDSLKKIIIDQLKWLTDRELISVYAFVIMPNHIHVAWEMLQLNGKEMPHASFNKWTSSQFLKQHRGSNAELLSLFTEVADDRKHRFWQRDPLAILMDSRGKLEQKINYIHLNPLQEKWSLASRAEEYRWSSAKFYEEGWDEFDILTHYRERF